MSGTLTRVTARWPALSAVALFTRDKNHEGNGTIDFEEFVSMMLCRSDTSRKQEQEEAFRYFRGGVAMASDANPWQDDVDPWTVPQAETIPVVVFRADTRCYRPTTNCFVLRQTH